MRREAKQTGFTLIEMLTVIGIIIIVMTLALPGFVAMMKGRRWMAGITSIQNMIWRARALATNLRTDMSVEFLVEGNNGTVMWLESENNDVEQMPDFEDRRFEIQEGAPSGSTAWGTLRTFQQTIWYASGGRGTVYDPVTYPPIPQYGVGVSVYYGDNARHSEEVAVGGGLTIDLARCEKFLSWDAVCPDLPYGRDDYRDIRLGPNGALVQSNDPVLCLEEIATGEYRRVTVVRCTGRVHDAD